MWVGGNGHMGNLCTFSSVRCLALKIAQPQINSVENNYTGIKPEKLIVYKSANPNENF